jgi:hypothetical protein
VTAARALRRHGATIAIVAAAAAMGVVVFIGDRGSITTDEQRARTKNLLPAFRADDVAEVRVAGNGRAARVFRGAVDDAGQRPWQVEIDGATYPADERAVDQLLASLGEGVVDRHVPLGAIDRGAMGLEAPRLLVSVDMGAQKYRVRIGGPAVTPAGALYAEVEGVSGGVVSAQLAAALDVAPEALREKDLVPYAASDVEDFTIDGAGGLRRFTRGDFTAPRGAAFFVDDGDAGRKVRAAAPALEKIWGAVGLLSADAFLADGDADKALQRALTLTIIPRGGGKKTTVDLGGSCPDHLDDVVAVRRVDGGARVSACVARGALDGLSLPFDQIADRRLVGARAEEVVDLKLSAGAEALALARSGSAWHEQAPRDRMIDADVGRGWLESLLAVEGKAFAGGDPKALGLDPPRATLRVASLAPDSEGDGGHGERVETLEVGDAQGAVVHVRRVEDRALLDVPKESADLLFPDETVLRPKKIYEVPLRSFRAVRIEAPGRVQRLERDADEVFAFVEPKGEGLVADGGFMVDLGKALGGLTAVRWAGKARPEQGLDRPRLVVTADLGRDEGEPKRTITVSLGAATEGGSFARTGDDATVFVAPKALEEAADRWLVDRSALTIDVGKATRITLAPAGGKKVVLEQTGGALHFAGGPADAEATARAAAVRTALVDLTAEVAVSVGAPQKDEGLDRPSLVMTVDLDGDKPRRIRFGAGDDLHGTRVVYARRDGVDATFAVAQSLVRPLLEAAGAAR